MCFSLRDAILTKMRLPWFLLGFFKASRLDHPTDSGTLTGRPSRRGPLPKAPVEASVPSQVNSQKLNTPVCLRRTYQDKLATAPKQAHPQDDKDQQENNHRRKSQNQLTDLVTFGAESRRQSRALYSNIQHRSHSGDRGCPSKRSRRQSGSRS